MRIPITRNSPIIKKKALGRHPTNEDALPRVNGVVAKGSRYTFRKALPSSPSQALYTFSYCSCVSYISIISFPL